MKKIILSNGDSVKIDDEDYNIVIGYKWHLKTSGKNKYAYRNIEIDLGNGKIKKTTQKIHRLILNLNDPKIMVDHINHDGLDNRRFNLRLVSASQNHMNRKKLEGTASKYKGVSYDKRRNTWYAYIKINGKAKRIGTFIKEIDAAKAYNKKAKDMFGEYALLNDID